MTQSTSPRLSLAEAYRQHPGVAGSAGIAAHGVASRPRTSSSRSLPRRTTGGTRSVSRCPTQAGAGRRGHGRSPATPTGTPPPGHPRAVRQIPEPDETWHLVLRLSSRRRTVVVLHFSEDLALVDIAALLDVPASTVRSDPAPGAHHPEAGPSHEGSRQGLPVRPPGAGRWACP
jgi:hypothetical protein